MLEVKNFVGKVVANFLSRRGYALVPITELKLRSREKRNFSSLCAAYEVLLSGEGSEVAATSSGERAELLSRQFGTPPAEAYYILSALWQTKQVAGDVCEFGVAQGELSALIAHEILSTSKSLHLFDSFEGLPPPGQNDELKDDVFGLGSMHAYAGQMAFPDNLVRERLRSVGFPPERTVFHKGFFADLVGERRGFPKAVCFAYVDFDFHDPILEALEFLHTVTTVGSIIIVDDYDFFSTGAKKAVDSFISDKNADATIYDVMVPDPRLAPCALLTRLKA